MLGVAEECVAAMKKTWVAMLEHLEMEARRTENPEPAFRFLNDFGAKTSVAIGEARSALYHATEKFQEEDARVVILACMANAIDLWRRLGGVEFPYTVVVFLQIFFEQQEQQHPLGKVPETRS